MILPAENQRIKNIIDYYCNGNELQFSKEIGISQPRINRLFSIDPRNNKYPIVSFEIIQAIINKFININSEWLIIGKGEMIKGENSSLNVSESNVKISTNDYTSFAPAVVTIDSHDEDNIALVPIPLSAGYLKGYSDPNFIANLPTFRMPGLNNGIFRMFEVEGHSMFPTLPNKSYVVGQFVENWITGIKDNQIYAVISNEVEGGLIKRCINKIKKYSNLICKSDNRRDYPTQNISPESIKEIWEIKLHLNFQLPDPADIYDKIYDLEGEVSSLKEIVKRAKLL